MARRKNYVASSAQTISRLESEIKESMAAKKKWQREARRLGVYSPQYEQMRARAYTADIHIGKLKQQLADAKSAGKKGDSTMARKPKPPKVAPKKSAAKKAGAKKPAAKKPAAKKKPPKTKMLSANKFKATYITKSGGVRRAKLKADGFVITKAKNGRSIAKHTETGQSFYL